jgi:hypothetical protein
LKIFKIRRWDETALLRQFFGGGLEISRMVRGPTFRFTYEHARKIARTVRGKKSEACGSMDV